MTSGNNLLVDPGLDQDTVLWRYLDTAKYLDMLHREVLFFSRGDQFEDEYEGSFTNSLKNAIQEAYEKNRLEMTYEEFRKRLRQRVFINSWYKSQNDSMAMWKLYGKSTLSVAVTTTIRKLGEQMATFEPKYRMFIRKVNYVQYWRDPKIDIKPYSNVFAYKVMAYDYEKEVRAIIDRFEEDLESDVEETGMNIRINLNDLVRSIVVMPEAPEWYVQLIQEVSRRFNLRADIHRSKLAYGPI